MGAKEQIVMWGSVLLVIIVIGLIATSGGENNYLNPSGNRNPANQKLMVVDQDTGEISFIQKSLQGVNAQIVADDSVILNILRNLLGDDLNNYAEYTKSGNNGVINQMKLDVIDRRVRDIAGVRARLDTVEKDIKDFKKTNSMTALRSALDSKISDGQYVALARDGDNGCGGRGCRAVTGFKQKHKNHGHEEQGWKEGDIHFDHGRGTRMRIWRNTQ